ncbi:MAG: hypothetical protein Roseis2KO_57700 [Roseivirga sp.]
MSGLKKVDGDLNNKQKGEANTKGQEDQLLVLQPLFMLIEIEIGDNKQR